MCHAITEGPERKVLWKNTGISTSDIRHTFDKNPCLFCTLAKRNEAPPIRTVQPFRRKSRFAPLRTATVSEGGPANQSFEVPAPEGDLTEQSGNATTLRADDHSKYKVGECISVDDVGPISPVGLNGEKYFMLCKDVKSGKQFVHLSKEPITSEFFTNTITDIISYFHKYQHRVEIIRADFAEKFKSEDVIEFCNQHRLERQYSAPYRHFQNSVERDVQTLAKHVSTIIHAQTWLKPDAWPLALLHSVELFANLPRSDGRTSPRDMIEGRQTNTTIDTNTEYLYGFGQMICYSVPKERRTWKFDLRNHVGIYVGEVHGMKDGSAIFNPFDRTIYARGGTAAIKVSDKQFLEYYVNRMHEHDQRAPIRRVEGAMHDFMAVDPIELIIDQRTYQIPRNRMQLTPFRNERVEAAQRTRQSNDNNRVEMDTRLRSRQMLSSMRSILEQDIVTEDIDHMLNGDEESEATPSPDSEKARIHNEWMQYILNPLRDPEDPEEPELTPESIFSAPPSEEQEAWMVEFKREYDSLIETTKALVPVTQEWLDANQHRSDTIDIKDVCRRKKRSDGTFDKLKMRASVRGDMLVRQLIKKKIKCPKTYSPTISTITFMSVFQLAVMYNMVRATMDIQSAYLQVEYPEDARPILVRINKRTCALLGRDPNQLYRVKRYVYGLPDAGRQFYFHYSNNLIKLGYNMSKCDPCLFYKITNGEKTYICIHVDDAYIFSNDQRNIDNLKQQLDEVYTTTMEQSQTDSFLGISFRTLPDGSVQLLQQKLIDKILMKYPTDQRNSKISHPYPTTTIKNQADPSKAYDQNKYLSLLGSLMFMTKSRPDILAACSFAATKSKAPTERDYVELLCIVHHLRVTRDKGLILRTIRNADFRLYLYCEVDASYLLHQDSRGHTGYCIGFGQVGFFYFRSQKQALVTSSSTQAEMRATFALVKDILYLLDLCKELAVPLELPAVIMEDNAAVIAVATEESAMMKRCKHFLMVVNFVRQYVTKELLDIRWIDGTDNTSDLLTKPLMGSPYGEKAQTLLNERPVKHSRYS